MLLPLLRPHLECSVVSVPLNMLPCKDFLLISTVRAAILFQRFILEGVSHLN